MREPHILLAGQNPRKIASNLRHILPKEALDLIEADIQQNVSGLVGLGREHFQFAQNLKSSDWRQRISRLYYAAYSASRSIRLEVRGLYSTDSTDHKKIGDLPDDFPKRSTYATLLENLRADRNLCDYDHTATEDDLLFTPDEARQIVAKFLEDVDNYLSSRNSGRSEQHST